MFLDKIQENELEYSHYAKETAKKYLTEFFGEKYKDLISKKIDKTLIVFVNRGSTDYPFTKECISCEKELLIKKFIQSLNDKNYINFQLDNNAIIDELPLNTQDKISTLLSLESIKNLPHEKQLNNFKNICADIINENILNNPTLLKECFEFTCSELKKIFTYNNSLTNLELNIPNFPNNIDVDIDDASFNSIIEKNITLKNNSTIIKNTKNLKSSIISYYQSEVIAQFSPTINQLEKNICVYPAMTALDNGTFIHELIHVSGSQIVKPHTLKQGIGNATFEKNNYDIESTNYDLLDEIITDYFSFKISEKIKIDELFFSKPDISLYSLSFPLVKPFIDKYLEDLKQCYLSNDMSLIEKKFGKQNIIDLTYLMDHFLPLAITINDNNKQVKTFKEGIENFNNIENITEDYEIKYYKCFNKMQKIMHDIDVYVNSKENCNINF